MTEAMTTESILAVIAVACAAVSVFFAVSLAMRRYRPKAMADDYDSIRLAIMMHDMKEEAAVRAAARPMLRALLDELHERALAGWSPSRGATLHLNYRYMEFVMRSSGSPGDRLFGLPVVYTHVDDWKIVEDGISSCHAEQITASMA